MSNLDKVIKLISEIKEPDEDLKEFFDIVNNLSHVPIGINITAFNKNDLPVFQIDYTICRMPC